jgi:hypothetical protein
MDQIHAGRQLNLRQLRLLSLRRRRQQRGENAGEQRRSMR